MRADRRGEGRPRRRASDRTQQRRHPLRSLLQDGIAEGAQLRGRRGVDEALLPGERRSLRRVRQAGGGTPSRRSSAAGALHERGIANGVPGLRMLTREEFREIEPHCEGICALHVPSTGIVDYTMVAQKYAELIRRAGGEIVFTRRSSACAQRQPNVVETSAGSLSAHVTSSTAPGCTATRSPAWRAARRTWRSSRSAASTTRSARAA